MYKPYYKVPADKFKTYLTAYYTLNALKYGGVDNWSWYSDSLGMALHSYNEENGTECETFEEVAEDIMCCYEEFYE